jgi:hypothetical protein
MGYITPTKRDVGNVKTVDKHFLDDALKDIMQTTLKDDDGTVKTIAERMAYGLVMDALYAETVKDRTTCKKLIYERVGGKPAVIEDEEIEELPTVSVRLKTSDAQKIKQIEAMDHYEEEPNDRVVVEIDDGPKMEF